MSDFVFSQSWKREIVIEQNLSSKFLHLPLNSQPREGEGFLNFDDCTEKTSFTKHFAE